MAMREPTRRNGDRVTFSANQRINPTNILHAAERPRVLLGTSLASN